jgi:hypothetical protein
MKKLFLLVFALALVLQPMSRAYAQAQATPQQLQSMIAAGQEQAALKQLNNVLQTHPNSGVAWYLVAEAQDASGNESAASSALAKADQLAPGLPFANPQKVTALREHIAATPAMHHEQHGGISPFIIIIALALLFIGLRTFFRRRPMPGMFYQSRFRGGPMDAPPGGPYGPGGGSYGPGVGPSYGAGPGGLGSSILTGLAAGAGFAAGERIVDNLMGRPNDAGMINPAFGDTPVQGRDDGLTGSPDWDSGSTGDDDQLNSGDSW